jgi:hypothetical protein
MVPKTVEISVEAPATMRVFLRATPIASFEKRLVYHSRLKPLHAPEAYRDALKE